MLMMYLQFDDGEEETYRDIYNCSISQKENGTFYMRRICNAHGMDSGTLKPTDDELLPQMKELESTTSKNKSYF